MFKIYRFNNFLLETERNPKAGDFKSLLPDNYWNDKRLDTLEKAYNADMSRKEMIRKHFPEANPRHIETALKKYKDRLNLKSRTTRSPTATRQFNEYWTPEKKQKLRRAWRSGEDLQTMHNKHFGDISFEALRKTTRILRKDLGLEPRNIPHRQPENLVSPIEERDREHILNDLKKGRSIERIASDHYANPLAIKQLKTKELGPTEKRSVKPYENIPQHHIDFANELRTKHPSEIDPNVKAKSVGRALIANALNSKFGHEEGFVPYDENQVDYMIRRGMISTPGRETYGMTPSIQSINNENKRKAIWDAHKSGKPIEDISKYHGIPINRVNRIIGGIQRRLSRSTPQKKESGFMENTILGRISNILNEGKSPPGVEARKKAIENIKKSETQKGVDEHLGNIHKILADAHNSLTAMEENPDVPLSVKQRAKKIRGTLIKHIDDIV